MQTLPKGYRVTARTLLTFLWSVARAEKNGLSSRRLGELFASVFFRPEDEVYYMQADASALATLTGELIEHCQLLWSGVGRSKKNDSFVN